MIKRLIVDCDGVLTDGMYNTSEEGSIFKTFFSRDFHGMLMLDEAGVSIEIVSAASDQVIYHQCRRAAPYIKIYTGVKDKLELASMDSDLYDWSEVAFMGDDLFDLPLLKKVGLPACPADADQEVTNFIRDVDDGFESVFSGGRGAVRDFTDYIRKGVYL